VSDIVVRTEGLGKRYRLGQREPYRALRDVLSDLARRPLRRLRSPAERSADSWIWAVRDLDLELRQGDSLGIIGRNGAGKSTLLKLLARITEPTAGRAEVAGRVGALLDVGTGFHPELTGRENLVLNGAILGMRRREIERRYDEIVAFAGVERFMDTPVKRFSAGMRARLAFAVAAHLEPDVLVVDEVLAVGDAEFQKKCLGRMGEAARSGRTVLFVSHNTAAIESLCSRAMWLEGGRCVAMGAPAEVTARYLATSYTAQNDRTWSDPAHAPGDERVRIRRALVRPEAGTTADFIDVATPFRIEFECWNLRDGARLNLSLHIYDANGILVFNAVPVNEREWFGQAYPRGLFRDICHVSGDLLNDGVYTVELLVVEDGIRVIHQDPEALVFEVRDTLVNEGAYEPWAGIVRPHVEWETHLIGDAP
jgi:lipopolysaccharide transport system ATP-binding protein